MPMIKILRLLFLVLMCNVTHTTQAQHDHFLSPIHKAYLFHTVKKSPILDVHMGRFFDYRGPAVLLPNGKINYDSTELIIINNPDFLYVYSDEIRKSPKGLLSEAANKMAVWELNCVLYSKRKNELEQDGFQELFLSFYAYFESKLPLAAFKEKAGERVLYPKLEQLFHPGLALSDKVAILDGINHLTAIDKKTIIDALSFAINSFVEKRSFFFFQQLGGEATTYINVLTAAGDGSNTSGLFEEREKDERGRWNQGLPKAVGLFPYQVELTTDPGRKKQTIQPELFTIHQFETVGNGRLTTIHLDVWGYNTDKQTTVVLDKGGAIYPLFGSAETRFLSPDSSYGSGLTYYALINRVQNEINAIEEKVSGKKGLDYWISYHEKRKQGKLLQIDKLEKELNDLRYEPISTTSKGKKKKKKLVAKSNQKKRHPKQETFIRYYEELAAINRKIKELQDFREKALHEQQILVQQVRFMRDLIGENWIAFKEHDGLYIFSDSAQFDMLTQEFTFPPSDFAEVFEIRLIAVPLSEKSSQADEVMLHINMTDATPIAQSRIQLVLNDVFESDKSRIVGQLFQPKDSLSVRLFLEGISDKKKPFLIRARGGGIGKWNGYQTVACRDAELMAAYPSNSRDTEEFKRLRTTQVYAFVERSVVLEVNSYTDPVKSNFSGMSKLVEAKMKQFNWTRNDVLSAYRSYETIQVIQRELNILAATYFSREEAKIIIDRLNKEVDKTKIAIGKSSLTMKELQIEP